MTRHILTFFFLPLLVLSACGPAATPAADTITPIRTLSHPPTTTRASTRTPQPTGQPETPTPTRTGTIANPSIQAQIWCPGNSSPDGSWCMQSHWDSVVVIGKAGQSWLFLYRSMFGAEPLGGADMIYWTPDNRFLYFAPRPIVDWVGIAWSHALTLLRMDTDDGSVTQVLPGNLDAYDFFYSLSISPTGRHLIYANNAYNPLKVNILDLNTGEETSLLFEDCYWNAAQFVWSEDGLQVSFLLDNHDACQYNTYSIDIVNLPSIPDTNPTAIP